MQIPTYTRQSQRPRQGSGQFLTAQLNPSAMMAPARAAVQVGESLARAGGDVAELVFKKAQIDAEQKALEALNSYSMEVADIADQALRDLSPADAEREFEAAAGLAERKATVGLNRLALDMFRSRAGGERATQTVEFRRANNVRFVEAAKANLTAVTSQAVLEAANTSSNPAVRFASALRARQEIDRSIPILGMDQAVLAHLQLNKDLAISTLFGILQNAADPIGVVDSFIKGAPADPVLQEVLPLLTPEQLRSIGNDALDAAFKIIEKQNDQRQAVENQREAEVNAMYTNLVNLDTSTLEGLAEAKALHQQLLALNYYKDPAKRDAIEQLFADEVSAVGFQHTEESKLLETALRWELSMDRLTYADLQRWQGQLSPEFLRAALTELDSDRNESQRDAEKIIQRALGITVELLDAQGVEEPIKQMITEGNLRLSRYINDNPQASRLEIQNFAEQFLRDKQEQVEAEMNQVARKNVNDFLDPYIHGLDFDPMDPDVSFEVMIEELTAALPETEGSQFNTYMRAIEELQRGSSFRVMVRPGQ